MANILNDAEQMNEHLSNEGTFAAANDEEFRDFSQKAKALAEKQRATQI